MGNDIPSEFIAPKLFCFSPKLIEHSSIILMLDIELLGDIFSQLDSVLAETDKMVLCV